MHELTGISQLSYSKRSYLYVGAGNLRGWFIVEVVDIWPHYDTRWEEEYVEYCMYFTHLESNTMDHTIFSDSNHLYFFQKILKNQLKQ